jgi:hypothetical protein
MDKTPYFQKLRRHCCKSEEGKWDRNVKPRKIPARTRSDEERAAQKLQNFFPNDFHRLSSNTERNSMRANVRAQRRVIPRRAQSLLRRMFILKHRIRLNALCLLTPYELLRD